MDVVFALRKMSSGHFSLSQKTIVIWNRFWYKRSICHSQSSHDTQVDEPGWDSQDHAAESDSKSMPDSIIAEGVYGIIEPAAMCRKKCVMRSAYQNDICLEAAYDQNRHC
jgi:hypothetical protein